MSAPAHPLLDPVRRVHEVIRDHVVTACERAAAEELAEVARDDEGDTLYAIDRVAEERLIALFERALAPHGSALLVAEGLSADGVVLPAGCSASEAVWRVIVDPIDGTRGLMYQKRSAWILTGVARNRGPQTGLQDIELAVQTEIPVVKQHESDSLWAVRGSGAAAERFDRRTGARQSIRLRPSGARSIRHGFSTVARFFPGPREELTAIDEEIVRGALGPVERGKASCFEDQYISTAGQLYELMAGHDRFVADLRPLVERLLTARGLHLGICCHPYDVCTELIARELGVVVCDPAGKPLSAPLALEPEIAWVGYANRHLRAEIEPHLLRALASRGLLP